MLSIALDTLRSRWAGFAGTFLGLLLGVGLLATVGVTMTGSANSSGDRPLRYAAAPVVVRPAGELSVVSRGYTDRLPLTDSPGLPPQLVAKVEGTGRTTVDRTFYAQLAGVRAKDGGHPVGHAWSAAAFTPYRLTAGRAPADKGEIVVGGGDPALVGHRTSVLTARGAATYTVSGVTAPVAFEQAVFFSDAEAARLSPRVDALVSHADPDAVRHAVGGASSATVGRVGADHSPVTSGVQVLTGDDRHDADAAKAEDEAALRSVDGLLGVAGGLAAFVSVFVVASTFAFSVTQRRRELALMRTAGATPRQVRAMVLTEAVLVGTAASGLGALLGVPGGPLLAKWLISRGQAPSWYHVSFSGYAVLAVVGAFVAGVLVAACGAGVACWRAGRVRPLEALQEAAVDRESMAAWRWACGLAALLLGVLLVVLTPLINPLITVAAGEVVAGVLVVALALLAPALSKPLVRLVTGPLTFFTRGATVLLVRQNALSAARRTAATATPVLVTVGLAAAVLGSVSTLDAARATELRHSTSADFTVVPHGTTGLSQQAVQRVREVPGTRSAPVTSVNVFGPQPGANLVQYTAQIVDPGDIGSVFHLPVVSGDLNALRDDSIVVDEEWGKKAGDKVRLFLPDGAPATLTVAAVVKSGVGGHAAFLTPAHQGAALVSRIDVKVRPDADPAAVAAGLRRAGRGLGARAVSNADWADAVNSAQAAHSWLNAATVLAVALVYTGLSIVNTLVMATTARGREMAMLRLSGATRRQVLRAIAGETLTVVAVGVALAAGVAVLTLTGLDAALGYLVGGSPVVVPWLPLGAITAACGAAALLGTAVAARLALRARPIELAGVRE
ncbi:ABC transporter permease [Streptomyces sp. NPDC050617]|uniref:ABC transporter permease n=1 Tax=Streptomyces sp. NPDC050617 TaxID=3154628 RepID=UPI003412E8B7